MHWSLVLCSLALAACYMAQAVVHCRAAHHTPATYPGLQDTLVDIPVNARRQVMQLK